jgi:SAM-dependent methyltransferase
MDKRELPGVDIVHDLEVFPWPLKDESCIQVVASHVLEHIKPWHQLDLFNEVWRIMKPKGAFVIAVPYGVGHGFVQDPTHCKPFNESTFMYYDPEPPGIPPGQNILYKIYEPKPWRIVHWFWQAEGFMEVILEKRT